jgi:flavin reductase (DIM6/NTAB) family NADH-FMN oxidoreductase RutF
VVNAEQSKEFVYNMATYDLREAVNLSAQEVSPEVDEFELAGVGKAPSKIVKPYRVKESPAQYECRYHQTLRLSGNGVIGTVDVVIGEVLAVHIKDEFIMPDGKLDIIRMKPIGRLGYYDYTCVESVFEMAIPGSNESLRAGMEGKIAEESENN